MIKTTITKNSDSKKSLLYIDITTKVPTLRLTKSESHQYNGNKLKIMLKINHSKLTTKAVPNFLSHPLFLQRLLNKR